jgi:hypothetical protein
MERTIKWEHEKSLKIVLFLLEFSLRLLYCLHFVKQVTLP